MCVRRLCMRCPIPRPPARTRTCIAHVSRARPLSGAGAHAAADGCRDWPEPAGGVDALGRRARRAARDHLSNARQGLGRGRFLPGTHRRCRRATGEGTLREAARHRTCRLLPGPSTAFAGPAHVPPVSRRAGHGDYDVQRLLPVAAALHGRTRGRRADGAQALGAHGPQHGDPVRASWARARGRHTPPPADGRQSGAAGGVWLCASADTPASAVCMAWRRGPAT